MPSPPIRKMVVKSRTNWKCKTWCYCTLYEVQFFISVPLRNIAEREIAQQIQNWHISFVAVISHHTVT
jgi:hypothetical protein